MKSWLIDSGLGTGFCFRLFALFLLPAAAACNVNVVVDDCSFGACLPEEAGSPGRDAGSAADAGAPSVESGVDAPLASTQRSPLCAVSGCFPGGQACGEIPVVDGGGDERSSLQPGADSGEEGEDSDDVAAPPSEGGVATLDAGSVATDAALIGIDVSLDRAAPVEASFDDSTSVPKACYVFPTASGVSAACAPAGQGAAGSTCRDSSDCASTLACVEIDGSGVCRPFSCALPPNCMPGTFYQQAPLIADGVALPLTNIPVCSPNVPCPLLEQPTTCTGGKVCAVTGQGETSCTTPGTSKQNEWCDEGTGCGEGLVCALRPDKTQNKCLKLCHIDMGAAECPGGTCQGGNNAIPNGFGICVGDTGDGG